MNNIRWDSQNFNHSFDWENVEILNFYKKLMFEMIHIEEQENGIDCNKDTELLDNSYFTFSMNLFNILNELTHKL